MNKQNITNPLSDLQPVPRALGFLPNQPGPIINRAGQVKILPKLGGPYIITNGETAAVVDHKNGIITWLKNKVIK